MVHKWTLFLLSWLLIIWTSAFGGNILRNSNGDEYDDDSYDYDYYDTNDEDDYASRLPVSDDNDNLYGHIDDYGLTNDDDDYASHLPVSNDNDNLYGPMVDYGLALADYGLKKRWIPWDVYKPSDYKGKCVFLELETPCNMKETI